MSDIFFHVPNFVDVMGALVVITFLTACEGVVLVVCTWLLAKLALFMYEDLKSHYLSV